MIQNITSYLKTAKDIINAISDNKSLAEVKGKLIELQNAILSAQNSALESHQEQAALIAEIDKLKHDIVKIKAWSTEKERYALKNVWNSGIVYALKKSVSKGEPAHYLCPNCYQDEIKSIMQPRKNADKFATIYCPKCKNEIHTMFRGIGGPEYAVESAQQGDAAEGGSIGLGALPASLGRPG